MADLTCHGCVHLEHLTKRLPQDKTDHLCRALNWEGYVDPAEPGCKGRKNGHSFLIRYWPIEAAADDWSGL